jgi:hypothetical protein
MPIKSLKKIYLNKKTEGILPLDITKDIEVHHFFATGLDLYTHIDSKFNIFTVGAQGLARVCQNLIICRRNISAHRKRRKLRFFLVGRTWA